MADILKTTFEVQNFMKENPYIFIKISLKFAPECPIDNKSALVQVMVKHKTGKKPLSDQMLIQI